MICSRDFCNKNKYNNETNEQLWMSVLSDTHELTCSCNWPFAHLLAIIFPIGHTDRNKTINEILLRDYKEKCRSSGHGDADTGGAETTEQNIKEEPEKERGGPGGDDAAFLAALNALEEEGGTR